MLVSGISRVELLLCSRFIIIGKIIFDQKSVRSKN